MAVAQKPRSTMVTILTLLLTTLSSFAAAATQAPSSLVVLAWPLSVDEPRPIANFRLRTDAEGNTTPELFKWTTPPNIPEDVVRLGIRNETLGTWSGVAVSRDVLSAKYDKTFVFHRDATGAFWHVDLQAELVPEPEKAKKSAKKDKDGAKVVLEEQRTGTTKAIIVTSAKGVTPVLNRPVVLNEDGKVEAEQTDNRTFLQKYWWAILLFLVINAVGGGGGGEEEK